jgi:PemK-like, MazF-like toxin of type II toxin-antitoxin system
VFGDVFIARFPFTSGTLSKPRPVLVLFDLQADVLICRVTSVLRVGPLDVALRDWQQAGLALPSVARLDRRVTAEKSAGSRHLTGYRILFDGAALARGRTCGPYCRLKALTP